MQGRFDVQCVIGWPTCRFPFPKSVVRSKNFMHPVETYVRDLRDTRATGTAVTETLYYCVTTSEILRWWVDTDGVSDADVSTAVRAMQKRSGYRPLPQDAPYHGGGSISSPSASLPGFRSAFSSAGV